MHPRQGWSGEWWQACFIAERTEMAIINSILIGLGRAIEWLPMQTHVRLVDVVIADLLDTFVGSCSH